MRQAAPFVNTNLCHPREAASFILAFAIPVRTAPENKMKSVSYRAAIIVTLAVVVSFLAAQAESSPKAGQKSKPAAQTQAPVEPQLISPEDLVKILQAPKGEKPLILNVGPRLLFVQAHIPGAEYIGAASEPQGIQALRDRVKSLPRNKFIVVYCGCCPWNHCPNVSPAYSELRAMGFTKMKVLYIPSNIGADWVYKGYPTARGE
jgi:thiosulfate/3-mercaptopyruvate sulfurtransferase